jgi:hypothetical protein
MVQQSLPFPAESHTQQLDEQTSIHKAGLPWIQVGKDVPYFVTEEGKD